MRKLKKFAILFAIMGALLASVASSSDDEGSGSEGSSSETTEGTGSSEPSGGNSSQGEGDELDDVTVEACAPDDTLGYTTATLKITNNSSKASDYFIDISFESPDGATNFGTGNAYVQRLAPGQSKTEEVTGFEEATGEFVCKVTKVDRTESL